MVAGLNRWLHRVSLGAAYLAAVLPSPRRYERGRVTPYVAARVDTILARMESAQVP